MLTAPQHPALFTHIEFDYSSVRLTHVSSQHALSSYQHPHGSQIHDKFDLHLVLLGATTTGKVEHGHINMHGIHTPNEV